MALSFKKHRRGGRPITKTTTGPFYCGLCGRRVSKKAEDCTHCGCELDDRYDDKPDGAEIELHKIYDQCYPGKKDKTMPKGQPKRNRTKVLNLDDVLEAVSCLSKAGHPHDYIDDDTARIRLECSKTGKPKLIIDWEGFPMESPEYGRTP